MEKKRIDLHNHTVRCHHAEGTIEEYVRKAVALGTDIYGFSEHAPMDFDEGYRLAFEEMEAYENDIKKISKIYKNDIDIRLGYEVDWLPGHMDERVMNADVDYLIGSVHFIDKWGFDNPEFLSGWKNRDIDEIWEAYFEAIEAMAKGGHFDIVGHLDLIKVFKYLPKRDIRLLARNALKAIKRSGMVLEINTAGLRKPVAELYPSEALLQEAYAMQIPVTFGSDAHAPDQVGFGYDQAVATARKIGYTHAVVFEKRNKQTLPFR